MIQSIVVKNVVKNTFQGPNSLYQKLNNKCTVWKITRYISRIFEMNILDTLTWIKCPKNMSLTFLVPNILIMSLDGISIKSSKSYIQ